MKVMFSVDDGSMEDMLLARQLVQYKIPATFYIPSTTELTDDNIWWLDNKGFIIGGHTTSHPRDLKTLSDEELENEIDLNKDWLEGLLSRKVDHFCYPRGKYNEKVIKHLEKVGYKYARTVDVGTYREPMNLYRIATSVHIHPSRTEYRGKSWLEYAFDMLDKASKADNGYFHVWCHTWELDKYNLWTDVVKLLEKINEYNYERANY